MSSRVEEVVDKIKWYGLEVLGVSEAKMRKNSMKTIGYATCVY